MPIGRQRLACVSTNAFRIDQALKNVYIPSSVVIRPFLTSLSCQTHNVASLTTSRSFGQSTTSSDATSLGSHTAASVNSSEDIARYYVELDRNEGRKLLKDALSALRRRNRGTDSAIFRKVEVKAIRIESATDEDAQAKIIQHDSQPLKQKGIKESYSLFRKDTSRQSKRQDFETPFQAFRKERPVFERLFHKSENAKRGYQPRLVFPAGNKDRKTSLDKSNMVYEYPGYAVRAQIKGIGRNASFSFPWVAESDQFIGLQGLNREIATFTKYIKPTTAESRAKEDLIRIVQEAVEGYSMGLFKIDVFGSVANGYDLSFADLDLRLCLSGVEDRIRAPSREDVIRLKRYLTSMIPVLQNLGFDTPELVHSRYPLLDTRYPDAAIKVQVVSANNTTLSKDFINLQIQEHPDLPSIYAVIRTMLKIRDLSDVFHGGIGSYTLVMMIIASLKLLPGESAGENLINFLEFYSTIDTKNHTIGLVPPGIHPKYRTKYDIPPTSNVTTREQRFLKSKHVLGTLSPELRFMLVLQDGVDHSNDLGRKAFAWNHIQATFKAGHAAMLKAIDTSGTAGVGASAGADGQQRSLLAPLVAGCHERFVAERTKAEAFGRKVMEREGK